MTDPAIPSSPAAPQTSTAAGTEPEILHGPDCFLPGVATGAPMADAAPGEPQRAARGGKHREGWLVLLQSLVTTIVIALFVVTFLTQAFQIPTESMENTLLVGDYLLVDKVHYGQRGIWRNLLPYSPVRRGDIIVFKYPINPSQHFVKRVIGLPGDHVRLMDGEVYVNGRRQSEPFVIRNGSFSNYRDNFPAVQPTERDGVIPEWRRGLASHIRNDELVVPKDSYFAMGDNRDDSSDSRYWGFVPRENIVGRPWLIYFSLSAGSDEPPVAGGKLASLIFTVRHFWEYVRWNRTMRLVN